MKTLTSLVLVCLFTGCFKLVETSIKEHQAVSSPDGKFVAHALSADAGAVSSHDQLVLLTPPNFVYNKNMDLMPFQIASIQRVSDKNIALIWNSSNQLTIRFTQHSPGYINYRSEEHGIRISIEPSRTK